MEPKGASADTCAQAEADVSSLRQELEAARQALRFQTARCRQVDAALSRRLEKKELESQRWRNLRDQQLSHVMRALLVLEAGLRREQRNVRALLGERDAVIHKQQLEIARLRKALGDGETNIKMMVSSPDPETTIPKQFEFEGDVKPDLISSLGISHFNRSNDKSSTPTTTDNEDSQSNLDSLQLSFYEVGSQPESLMSNISTQSCNGDTCDSSDQFAESSRLSPPRSSQEDSWNDSSSIRAINNNNISSDMKHSRCQEPSNNFKRLEVQVHMEPNYHLCSKNVLSPVKEENSLSLMSACASPARCNSGDDNPTTSSPIKDCKPSPSTLLQEVRISGRNEYEDNPVLNCVNQILLRDQEEFLEEQRALRLKEQEKSKKEAEAKLNNKKLTKSTENLSLLNEQIIVQHSPVKGKVYPPIQTMSHSHHVVESVLKHPISDKVHEDHYNNAKTLPPSPKKRTPLQPPALPPKPQKLLLRQLDQKTIINSILPELSSGDANAINIIKNRIPLSGPSPDNELYVISNSAIDDELLQQIQGRRAKNCSEIPISLNKSRDNLYPPALSHPTHKPLSRSQNEKTSTKKVTAIKDEDPKSTPKTSPAKKVLSPKSCIKVASPVSTLLNTVDAIEPTAEDEGGKKTSPSVSQIVRRFEDLGTQTNKDQEDKNEETGDIQKNFEEFRLDECDMETLCGEGAGRPEGDGAETRLQASAAVLEARISYENFLEATGLSQKSIMTPSRLFSNHKSVLKPKDVKHRSRVKAAAVVDRCNNPTAPTAVVRYWTEPFL